MTFRISTPEVAEAEEMLEVVRKDEGLTGGKTRR